MHSMEATMSSQFLVHHTVAHIDIDEELQREVRRLIERVDRQVAQWAKEHPAGSPTPERPPLILMDVDVDVDVEPDAASEHPPA
jgi:hypothetical protein